MEEPFTKGYQIPCLEIGIEQPKESSCALKESKGEEIHEQVSGGFGGFVIRDVTFNSVI